MRSFEGKISLSHALKEWHVAVKALADGDSILLLRKGGIREGKRGFTVSHGRVLLYPTYEHQKRELLKSTYTSFVQPVEAGWHPATITLTAWADIEPIFSISQSESLNNLLPFHIWNEQFVSERFRWKPQQPLYILCLRAYRLPRPVSIPFRAEYGGCRSWIDLAENVSLQGSMPVLEDKSYSLLVESIREAIH